MDDENLLSLDIFFNDSGEADSSNSKLVSNKNVDVKQLKKTVGTLMCDSSTRLKFAKKVIKNPKMGKPSDVWDNYQQAFIDEKPVDIYKCNKCPSLFYYKAETGNTSMKRHTCDGKKNSSIQSVQKIEKFLSRPVPAESVRKLNRDITVGIASDLEPLYRVEGKGFLHVCQSLINFGATHGRHPVETVIQHRKTLKRTHVPAVCDEIREDLKKKLAAAPSYPRFAFSKDMWSEKYNSTHFLSLTCYFIDENWNLQSVTLGLEEVDDVKRTENIRKGCRDILIQYFGDDTDLVMDNSFSTTDGGSNMLKVLLRRLPCQCHKLNLFIQWTFNEKPIPSEEKVAKRAANKKPPFSPKKFFNFSKKCPEMFKCMEAIRNLVTYFKQSKLNSKLTTTLKQTVPTRWNGELLMLEAYEKSAIEVREILSKQEKLEKLIHVKDSLVKELIAFLMPFRDCSETPSGDKYPTIQLVALYFQELKHHIQIRDGDSNELVLLKTQAGHCFKEYLVASDIYYAASMLDPRYKSLKFVDSQLRAKAVDLLKSYMNASRPNVNKCGNGSLGLSTDSERASVASKNEGSKFSRLMDEDSEEYSTNDVELELDRYMAFRLEKSPKEEKFNILDFWRDADQFPLLKRVANWLLAIPASEAADERTFSSAGIYVTPKSTSLSAKTLSDMVFIKKNANI